MGNESVSEKSVELVDVSMKVCKVLDYLSSNSEDEGLSFILENCRLELDSALKKML